MITEHQKEIVDNIVKTFRNNNLILLKGSAGVGKTFIIKYIINALKYNYLLSYTSKIFCTAPTNKAVDVIISKMPTLKNSKLVNFKTVHSALNLERHIDEDGEISFIRNDKKPLLKDVGLLIIDESSMINTYILDLIKEISEQKRIKILMLGK